MFVKHILHIFGEASGLTTNMSKTQVFPIQCNQSVQQLLSDHQLSISTLPTTYLGLPLHTRKLSRAPVEPLVQKIANRLLGWKRDFFSYPGRELLIKTVLTAMPTYFLTAIMLPNWAIHHIDRYRRSFLWRGIDL